MEEGVENADAERTCTQLASLKPLPLHSLVHASGELSTGSCQSEFDVKTIGRCWDRLNAIIRRNSKSQGLEV